MKEIFCLYGINGDDFSNARCIIESCLGIRMCEHESSYHCGGYFRYETVEGIEIILQLNFNCEDEEYAEQEYKQFNYLLYYSYGKNENDNYLKALSYCDKLSLLRFEKI